MTKLTDEELTRIERIAGNYTKVHYSEVLLLLTRIQAQADEIEALLDQVIHMGEIMDGVANALKGVPPAYTLHSTHDIAELTAAKVEEVRVLREGLGEAVTLVNDHLEGTYKIDSFTTQPWEKALAAKEGN